MSSLLQIGWNLSRTGRAASPMFGELAMLCLYDPQEEPRAIKAIDEADAESHIFQSGYVGAVARDRREEWQEDVRTEEWTEVEGGSTLPRFHEKFVSGQSFDEVADAARCWES